MNRATNNSLTVYTRNGTVYCAPFGKDNLALEFKGVEPFKESRWQHISCGFKTEFSLWGEYLAFNRSETSRPIPKRFSMSLASTPL